MLQLRLDPRGARAYCWQISSRREPFRPFASDKRRPAPVVRQHASHNGTQRKRFIFALAATVEWRSQLRSLSFAAWLDPLAELPAVFAGWFAARGWQPRAHQLALLARAEAGESALLIAPTGAGKTLAGFLPSLVELGKGRARAARRCTRSTSRR